MSLDLSVLWIIVSVLLSVAALNWLVFKPLTRIMSAREQAIRSAQELAARSAAEAAAATAEFEARTRAARTEIAREFEDTRKAGEALRHELVEQTRAEVDAHLARASEELARDTAEARAGLEADARRLGDEMAERVLGRRVS
ncbi:MAG: ATP synthase F0 subunit B [Vicinamibacteraceae bacterium]|nr:ATP synthase F0 subunit B [Vicinamibacteraceae bacterium]